MLTFKGDFDVIQATGVFDGAAQQRREGHQIGDIFPLAGLSIKMQQSRRLNIEKLQHALFVPRHHPIVHALQQAVHLIEVAVGFRQQAVGEQGVTHLAGDGQRQGEVGAGLVLDQTAKRDRAEQPPVVIKHRRRAKTPWL